MGPADAAMGAGPRLLFRFFRTVVTPNLGRVGRDLQAMENELTATRLDWYAPRPIKLTDGPLTGHVQASDRFTMKTISRADVAWYILSLAENPSPASCAPPSSPPPATAPAWRLKTSLRSERPSTRQPSPAVGGAHRLCRHWSSTPSLTS